MAAYSPTEYRRIIEEMGRLEQQARDAERRARDAEQRARDAEQRARHAEQHPEKAKILKGINKLRKEEKKHGRDIYYKNQKATALEVCESIANFAIVFLMVLAVCQSGKTGCMLAIIEILLRSNSEVSAEHIFVITGLSDKEWVAQTKRRIPLPEGNVIHRGQLKRKTHLFENLKNAVIIVDECHIACKDKMSVDNILQQAGLKDLQYLKKNNITIVEFSATPNSTLDDIEDWKTCSKKCIMKPGDGYKGHKALIDDNRLFQAEDLFIADNPEAGLTKKQEKARKKQIKPANDAIKDLKDFIEKRYRKPRYHIIRTPHTTKCDTVMMRFSGIFGSEKFAFVPCFGEEESLMKELAKVPDKHTFLFIKETARCAVTFDRKDLIGVLYERMPKNPKHDVIVQGLAGRACGYDVDDDMIVFSNVESIERYVAMVESNFTERDGFKHSGKKKTHLHNSLWRNTEGESVEVKEEDYFDDLVIAMFDRIEEARTYIKNTEFPHKAVGARGPSVKSWEKKKDKRGFYLSTSGKGKNKTKVRTFDEIYQIRKWGLDDTHAFTFHPCYEDITKKNTLKWCVIHR